MSGLLALTLTAVSKSNTSYPISDVKPTIKKYTLDFVYKKMFFIGQANVIMLSVVSNAVASHSTKWLVSDG